MTSASRHLVAGLVDWTEIILMRTHLWVAFGNVTTFLHKL